MLKKKQRSRKQIKDLQMDLEVINPIESKKVLGGDWYNDWDLGWLNEVVISGGGGGGGWYDPFGGLGDPWGGSQDGGYSGGGGGDTFYYPVAEFPDHICKQQLTTSMDCATIAFSYVANYFGATGLTSSDFAEMVGQNYTYMSAGLGGFTDANMNTVLSTVFQSTTIDSSLSSIAAQVSSGNPIIAGFDNPNGTSHEVVITSVDTANNTIGYMDPAKGVLVNEVYNSAKFFELYAISGLQNNATVNQYKNDKNDISFCSICGH